MNYLKPILRYAIPYKFYAFMNVICNIFYAFFGTLSMISLFPMLKVLFGDSEAIFIKPKWEYKYNKIMTNSSHGIYRQFQRTQRAFLDSISPLSLLIAQHRDQSSLPEAL